MTIHLRNAAAALIAATCLVSTAASAASPISITPAVNANLSSYTQGTSYPNGGSTVTVNGVDFVLAGSPAGEADIIQTTFRSQPDSITFSVTPVSNIARLYTLVNTAFGSSTGVEAGYIDFLFSGGQSYRYTYTSGVNTRDHFGAGATVSNVFGTAAYSSSLRFDAQEIVLPVAFQSQTLTGIRLVDTLPSNNASGSPFLAAVSYTSAISAVPEPATWAMMLVGFGVIGGTMRRRKTSARVRFA